MLEWFRIRRKAQPPVARAERCRHQPMRDDDGRLQYWDVRKTIDGCTTLTGCYATRFVADRVKESLEREWANAD